MFGTIHIGDPDYQFDGRALFAYATGYAKECMAQAKRSEGHRDLAILAGDLQAAERHVAVIYRMRNDARLIISPFLSAIRIRTRVEKADAAALVEAGAAWFAEPSCSGETCMDCDLPLWHHIYVGGEGLKCPFGRRFWQIARALCERTDPKNKGWGDDTLRDIARH